MALLFDASTEYINCGSASMLDDLTTYSFVCWVKPTVAFAAVDTRWIYKKGDWGNGHDGFALDINATPDVVLMQFRQRATTPLNVQSIQTANLAVNKWSFLASSINLNGVDTDQYLYIGYLNTIVSEVGAYALRGVGSGTPVTNAAQNFILGNNNAFTEPTDGAVGIAMIFNKQLSLGELRTLQFRPIPISGCLGFWVLHGTGTQPDLSGNGNNGTVTGATITDHIPIGPPFGFDMGWMGAYSKLSIPVAMNQYRQRWA